MKDFLTFLVFSLICPLGLFNMKQILEENDHLFKEYKQEDFFKFDSWKSYDKRIRPNLSSGLPVNVSIYVWISSIHSVSEITMDYGVTLFLVEEWEDPRLAFNGTSAVDLHSHSSLLDTLWTPDIYFTNEKEGRFHSVTIINKQIRVYPNGHVVYDMRLSLTLACYFQLSRFPFDLQSCGMQLETFGYTTKDVVLDWDKDHPLYLHRDLRLPQFTISNQSTYKCFTAYPLGEYACLEMRFNLSRELTFYLLETYIPSILLVALSWVSFWMSADSTPARASLGITTVLTLTTLGSGARDSLPKVSYTKAIDIWMCGCSLFVFAALVEFAVVHFLYRSEDFRARLFRRKLTSLKLREDVEANADVFPASPLLLFRPEARLKQENFQNSPPVGERLASSERIQHRKGFYGNNDISGSKIFKNMEDYFENRVNTALMVDKASRLVFPLAFITFNVIYWCFYLFS